MNIKTKLTISVAGAALAATALCAVPASASTPGCTSSRFACGDWVSAAANAAGAPMPNPLGWTAWTGAGKAAAGDPVVAGPDLATRPATDFKLNPNGSIAYRPGGRWTGLCVGVNVIGRYRYRHRFTVRPGVLVLAGCDNDWAERWERVPDDSVGVELVNDYSGKVAVPSAKAGSAIATIWPPKKAYTVTWGWQGGRGL